MKSCESLWLWVKHWSKYSAFKHKNAENDYFGTLFSNLRTSSVLVKLLGLIDVYRVRVLSFIQVQIVY